MATNGSVTIDLNNIGDMVNNSGTIAEKTIEGVADQGDLIGLAIGLSVALGLLVGVIVFMLGVVVMLIRKTKGIKKA